MASWQAFAMRTILRFTMKRAGRNGIDVDKTRASLGAPRPEVLKFWPGWNVGPRVVEGLTFETYDRADGPTLRDDLVVLYLHGGGYFFGSPQTHRQLALNMAKHCDAPVFSLDYRLAPEHRFPAALDDAVAAYQWLVKTYPQRRFIIAGDSAGGGLAINTALEARSRGLPRPAAVITLPCIFAQYTERVPMVRARLDRRASTATGYAWLVWQKPPVKSLRLLWVPPCRKALERDSDYPSIA